MPARVRSDRRQSPPAPSIVDPGDRRKGSRPWRWLGAYYATLLSRGVYLASIRTMYRLLAASGESGERRAQRGPMTHAKPTLTATAPNQIWTWDISVPQKAA